MNTKTHLWVTAGIGIAAFLVLIALTPFTKTTGFIPDIALFIALTLGYVWFSDTLRINSPILTMLIIGHLTHAAGAIGWYGASPLPIQWDHVTHFFGALPFAFVFFRFLETWMDNTWFTKKNAAILLLVFLAATGMGALVELIEFLGFLTFGTGEGALMFGHGDGLAGNISDAIDEFGGGWINTGWDLVYNTLGILLGMIIMILVRVFYKKSKKAYYFEPIGSFSRRL